MKGQHINSKFNSCDFLNCNLSQSGFNETIFTGCILENVDMTRTSLAHANLSNTNLMTVKFGGSGGNDLFKCNLERTNLTEVDLSFAYMINSNLSFSTLINTKLIRTKLIRANLMYADLTGADLTDADLTSADLTGADLTGANLTGVNLSYANLTDTIITDAIFNRATIISAIISNSQVEYIMSRYIQRSQQDSQVEDFQDYNEDVLPSSEQTPRLTNQTSILENVQVDESKLPSTCYDFVMQDDLNIDEEMTDEADFFILVFPSENENFNVICKTREEIKISLTDGSSIFYECTGDFIRDEQPGGIFIETRDKKPGFFGDIAYIKVTGVGGALIYFDVKEVNTLLNSNERVYYVYPVKEITHSISWNNAHGDQNAVGRYISANHCQDRSSLNIYTLKVCEGDCIISNKFR
jgi:uncharacterized protein YjbI with pentapeptide repeats